MKKVFFLLAALCLSSKGFPQSNRKSIQIEYGNDIFNEGDSDSFASDLSNWKILETNEKAVKASPTNSSTAPTTTPHKITPPTTPPTTTTHKTTSPTTPPTTTTHKTTSPTTPPTTTPHKTTSPTTPPTTTPHKTTSPTTPPTTTPHKTTSPTTPPTTTPPTTPPTTTPPTTTPKGGAASLNSTSLCTFAILFLVHSICKYK